MVPRNSHIIASGPGSYIPWNICFFLSGIFELWFLELDTHGFSKGPDEHILRETNQTQDRRITSKHTAALLGSEVVTLTPVCLTQGTWKPILCLGLVTIIIQPVMGIPVFNQSGFHGTGFSPIFWWGILFKSLKEKKTHSIPISWGNKKGHELGDVKKSASLETASGAKISCPLAQGTSRGMTCVAKTWGKVYNRKFTT